MSPEPSTLPDGKPHLVDVVLAPVASPAPPLARSKAQPRSFGDYELLDEIARGGMGVVYQARQISLNRVVALKLILAGHLALPAEVQRFRTEAENAGSLDHPNIVPIYEVGEHGGQHYFSMKLVEGSSLAQHVSEFIQAPRRTAQLLATIARAVHYAHQCGILHRDLKPANILLDARGEPHVTDFGLARRLGADCRLTHSNAIVGTPHYIAPELAAGQSKQLTTAMDVYALGVILYELLTGRPPFQGDTPFDILTQVVNQDPESPRRWQPGVPRDLEVVCLKCLRKDPAQRYASAESLAEDLEHFLAGEPIAARATGSWERSVKWLRRHPAVTAFIVLSTLGLLSLVALGLLFARQEHQRALAEAGLRRQAEKEHARALSAVDKMLARVGAVDLADVPQMETVRAKMLDEALGFYRAFLDEGGDDPALRRLAGGASGRLAEVQQLQGDFDAAEKTYATAIALLEALANEEPDQPEHRRHLARCLHNRGVLLKQDRRYKEAEESFRRAFRLREEIAHEFAGQQEYQREVEDTRYMLGALLARLKTRSQEADDAYQKALAHQEQLAKGADNQRDLAPTFENQGVLRELARTQNNRGILLAARGDAQAAAEAFLAANEIQHRLLKKFPGVPAYRWDLARSCGNLGNSLLRQGKRQQALDQYHQARDLLTALALNFPTVPDYRRDLATVYSNLGVVSLDGGQTREAEASLREALGLLTELVARFPGRSDYRRDLGEIQHYVAIALQTTGRLPEAEQHYDRALALQRELVARHPDSAECQIDLGLTLYDLAMLLRKRQDLVEPQPVLELVLGGAAPSPLASLGVLAWTYAAWAKASDCFRQAVGHGTKALQADPENPSYREHLRHMHFWLTDTLLYLGEHVEAATTAEELSRLNPEDKGEYYVAATFLARCYNAAVLDAKLGPVKWSELQHAYKQKVLEQLQEARRKGFRKAEEVRRHPAFRPLLDDPDFKQFLRELDEKGGVGVGVG